MFSSNICRILCISVVFCATAAAAVWVEAGDAGQTPASAQGGPSVVLDAIFGDLTAFEDIDLYRIYIPDPLLFSAYTVEDVFNVPDPKLFLFTEIGRGIYAVDDDNGTQARFPAGDPLGLLTAGNYLLGISRFGFRPLSASGRIFPDDLGLVTASGPGGGGVLNEWEFPDGNQIDPDTSYEIQIRGAVLIPEPSTFGLAMAGFGLLLGMRARKARRN